MYSKATQFPAGGTKIATGGVQKINPKLLLGALNASVAAQPPLSPVQAQRPSPTFPVVLVVAGAGHGDEGGEEEGEEEGTEAQGPAPPAWNEAVQLPCQVEGREGETSKGNWKRTEQSWFRTAPGFAARLSPSAAAVGDVCLSLRAEGRASWD